MKYSDEQIAQTLTTANGVTLPIGDETEHAAANRRELVEIIEQLRVELAEAKQQRDEARQERADYIRNNQEAWDSVPARITAYIKRKRARIAALKEPCAFGLPRNSSYLLALRNVLAILDDKETPHA